MVETTTVWQAPLIADFLLKRGNANAPIFSLFIFSLFCSRFACQLLSRRFALGGVLTSLPGVPALLILPSSVSKPATAKL
jgi:hypothetical protein